MCRLGQPARAAKITGLHAGEARASLASPTMFSKVYLLLLSVSSALGADCFVSPRGDDAAAGSKAAPWRTIQYAADSLKPGDTAFVLTGHYNEKVKIRVSGAAGKPVTLLAEGGVSVSGKGVEGESIFLIEDQSHVRLVGFEIRDNLKVSDGSGIRVQGSGSHIEIRSCRVHEIRGKDAMGITVYGTSADKAISNLVIDGNEVYDCDPARSEALTLNGNVSEFQVTNNVVRDMNNIGIDFIGGEDWVNKDRSKVVRNGVCRGNKVFRCRSNYEGGYAAGIYVDGGKDIVIEKNIVSECDLGIEIGAENKGTVTTGIEVKDNMIFGNDKAGIVFGGYERGAGRVEGCSFTGNTCYHNDRHEKEQNGELWIQWASNNRITGNTFWCGEGMPLVQVDANAGVNVIDGNQYYSEAGEDECYFNWKDNDVDGFADWKKISKQDAGSTFRQPQIALPAIR